ncbi:nitrate reductase cytochrome c-type subunit [Pseudomarimonas salicorniae]|uniref:Periplasmic nitrate reductase, electron transfer subunit n=1 Tax=Pseudomarimonas salicorniae TaxID=2933270 RepID=A0ABT0GDQ1_9GAMM|nr:nitrate reductase cytochrome c-type subunit [Lysobacter sp. CAU 1642]MCK7592675.1 nitrate reductase cytochrome c-type subunit [Lysobacter sp. CAU 1642]
MNPSSPEATTASTSRAVRGSIIVGRWSVVAVLACMMLAAALVLPALAQDPEANTPAPSATEYRSIDALRRGAPLTEEPPAAPMARVENQDLRRQRGWPEQPPTIPHSIDGYQVSKEANRCMICHSRGGSEQFQAPMVSVTHFMDREGQVLAQISARRFFCNQCHVVQTDAKPLVENGFLDVDRVITAGKER